MCVHVCVRACVRACMRVCVCVCVCVCVLSILLNALHFIADYKFRKDEIFKRMKVTTFVQLVSGPALHYFIGTGRDVWVRTPYIFSLRMNTAAA